MGRAEPDVTVIALSAIFARAARASAAVPGPCTPGRPRPPPRPRAARRWPVRSRHGRVPTCNDATLYSQ
jgi:hypothetical protein